MTKRIWELDALRGLCILVMAAVHLVYDLVELYRLIPGEISGSFRFLMEWGGVVFVMLSGCCATLGRNPVRRGFQIFSCGMLITVVTMGLVLLGFDPGSIIWFGVLHCLGACMVMWGFLKKLPRRWLLWACIAAVMAGFWLNHRSFSFSWLVPLGFVPYFFVSADYFPLLPYLGFFLLGALLGEKCYPERKSLLPGVNAHREPIGFLCFCGRHSLPIYLLHQPAITGLLWLLSTNF